MAADGSHVGAKWQCKHCKGEIPDTGTIFPFCPFCTKPTASLPANLDESPRSVPLEETQSLPAGKNNEAIEVAKAIQPMSTSVTTSSRKQKSSDPDSGQCVRRSDHTVTKHEAEWSGNLENVEPEMESYQDGMKPNKTEQTTETSSDVKSGLVEIKHPVQDETVQGLDEAQPRLESVARLALDEAKSDQEKAWQPHQIEAGPAEAKHFVVKSVSDLENMQHNQDVKTCLDEAKDEARQSSQDKVKLHQGVAEPSQEETKPDLTEPVSEQKEAKQPGQSEAKPGLDGVKQPGQNEDTKPCLGKQSSQNGDQSEAKHSQKETNPDLDVGLDAKPGQQEGPEGVKQPGQDEDSMPCLGKQFSGAKPSRTDMKPDLAKPVQVVDKVETSRSDTKEHAASQHEKEEKNINANEDTSKGGQQQEKVITNLEPGSHCLQTCCDLEGSASRRVRGGYLGAHTFQPWVETQ